MLLAAPAGGLFLPASGRRKVLHRTSNFKLQQEPFRFNPDQREDSKKKIPLHGRKNAERFLLRARSARGAPIQGVRFPSRTATGYFSENAPRVATWPDTCHACRHMA